MQPASLNDCGNTASSIPVCIITESKSIYEFYLLVPTLLKYAFSFKGSLEDQLSRLREYEEAVYQFKPHLEELERINQQIQVTTTYITFLEDYIEYNFTTILYFIRLLSALYIYILGLY